MTDKQKQLQKLSIIFSKIIIRSGFKTSDWV
jgi:hypothetical protein